MKRRMVYPDVLRALSCIATVFLSVSLAAGCAGASGLLTWVAPMFVMLSGMFFLDSNWYIGSRDMAQRYGLRLLASYVVWATVAMGVNVATGGVLKGLLGGSGFYLNFLFMMIILYAFSPILRILTRAAQPRELGYVVIFGILLGCIYPFIQIHLGTTRLGDYAMMGFGYIGVFAAGWFLRTAALTRKHVRIIYLLGGVCLILSLRGIWMGQSIFSTDPALMVLSPDAVLIAIALFLVVKNTLAGTRLPRKALRPVAILAQISFGIYLIHPILLAILCYALNAAGIVLPTAVFIPAAAIGLLVVSGILSLLIRKIPKIGRYLA